MKKYIKDFLHRGFVSSWGGPFILGIIYLAVGLNDTVSAIAPLDAAKAILSLTIMAFIAGGITVVYQIDSLPLFPAILIHGVVLYLDYLMMYFVNGWLEKGTEPLMMFTAIFIVGYAIVWGIIYSITKKDTKKLNRLIG